jgi:hypothetical protein
MASGMRFIVLAVSGEGDASVAVGARRLYQVAVHPPAEPPIFSSNHRVSLRSAFPPEENCEMLIPVG